MRVDFGVEAFVARQGQQIATRQGEGHPRRAEVTSPGRGRGEGNGDLAQLEKAWDSTHPADVPACHAANGTWSARGVEGSLDARQLPQMHRVSSVPFSWLFPPRYSRSPAIRKRRRSVRTLLKEAPCVGKGVPRNPRPAATSTSLADTSPSPFASAYPRMGFPAY